MGLYGPILTGVGLLENGNLTKAARDTYVDEVLALMATGNDRGRGGSPTTQVFSSLLPLPPVPGPNIVNVTTLKSEPLFWFGPDPVATLMAVQLKDPSNNPVWQAIFPDLIYAKTAVALDLPGNTPLFPVFDVSAAFGIDLPLPFTLPDLALKLNLTPPDLAIKLSQLGIQLSIPTIPIPPLPPKVPDVSLQLPVPPLVLPDFCIGLIKLPFDLLEQLLLPPNLDIVLKLIKLDFSGVFDIAFNIVLQLLKDLNLMLVTPKLLIASLLIYLKDVVAMVCTVLVGSLVGAGGGLTKLVAVGTGLIEG
jgi:hypothetical protein